MQKHSTTVSMLVHENCYLHVDMYCFVVKHYIFYGWIIPVWTQITLIFFYLCSVAYIKPHFERMWIHPHIEFIRVRFFRPIGYIDPNLLTWFMSTMTASLWPCWWFIWIIFDAAQNGTRIRGNTYGHYTVLECKRYFWRRCGNVSWRQFKHMWHQSFSPRLSAGCVLIMSVKQSLWLH